MKVILILLALFPLLTGCVERTYNVRAYDLKGEKIYEGQLLHKTGDFETKDGRKVSIINATVIMEEVK